MEVGCPEKCQEEDQGPSRRPPNSKGEGHEGIGDHRRLPYMEGGAADELRASPIPDGALASLKGTVLIDEALPLQSGVAHQGGDGSFEGQCRRCP